MRVVYISIFLFALFIGCSTKEEETKRNSENLTKITALADAYVEAVIKHFPENYTFFSLNELNHSKLSDNSLAGIERWNEVVDSLYCQFEKIKVKHEVGSNSWYLYGFLKEAFETSVQFKDCKTEFLVINHLSGWQIRFGRVISNQPVGTDKARIDAIKRWNQLPGYIDNEITNLKTGIKQGYTVPKTIVALVIEQLDKMLSEPVIESVFYNPAKRDSSKTFKEEWENLVTNVIYPAIKKYHSFLKSEYYQAARDGISISELPNGKKIYEAYYRYFTSVKRKTNKIIEISNYRVKVNNSKLRLHGRELYGSDSIPLILSNIISDTTHYFKTADEMLQFAKETVKKAKKMCKQSFTNLPSMEIVVEAIPAHAEANQGSHYIPSINDTSKAAVYYINLSNPQKRMRGQVETEIFHETFPGHHLQVGLSVEKKTSHLITQLFMVEGFTEGWASYAQILANELGLYNTGYSRFFILGRSSRIMYLEAMIHSGKWDKKQAIDYLLANGTSSIESAKRIINRITTWPGQFSTYDTGLIEFLELREKAMLTLGDEFDIKEFHTVVLEGGAIPLEMLREKVNWWLTNKTKDQKNKTGTEKTIPV